ncbi:MAG: TRAP transporter substrate-binding protein [Rhodospirillales bacterium]|nr:TRAP transporter substrate-binding protein [Rhodospirillales bacterium]
MSKLSITFGGYQGPGSVHTRGAEVFGRELSERLGGEVSFNLDDNITLSRGAKAADLLDLTETGELTMCYFASSYLARRVPEVGVLDLPFLIDFRIKAYAALDGDLGRILKNKFAENTGFRVLGFWDNGFRHFTNGAHPIHSPADCRGLKLRSMNSELHQKSFRRLGFEPLFVDVADLVSAARSGEIDAQENPLTNNYRFGLHKFHPYITLSGHLFGTALLLCNKAAFDGWDGDVQNAVRQAADAATTAQRQFAAAEDEEMMALLRADGVEPLVLTDAERQEFKDAVQPVVDEARSQLGEELFGKL